MHRNCLVLSMTMAVVVLLSEELHLYLGHGPFCQTTVKIHQVRNIDSARLILVYWNEIGIGELSFLKVIIFF